MGKLNVNEMIVGLCYGLAFSLKFHFWAIPLAFATSLLWAMGGAEHSSKLYRRIGCSLLPCLVAFLLFHKWRVFISFPWAWACISIGYGIPDSKDSGSWLGRIMKTEFKTRLVIYCLLAVSFIPIFIC